MARSMPLVTTMARAWPPILLRPITCSWKWSTMISAFCADGVVVGLHIAAQLLLGLLGVELRVVLHRLRSAGSSSPPGV